MSITLTAEDDSFTYTNNEISVNGDKYVNLEKFNSTNNIKVATTQGFLVKVQKGDDRMQAKVQLADLESNITANLYPMLNQPSTLNVTFERNVPFRGKNTGKYELVNLKIMNEWPTQGEGGADVLEVELFLTEVIAV